VEPRELKPGLWRWMARHPDWRAEEGGESGWQPDVACHAWTAPDALVLFDPLLTTGAAWRWLDGLVERQEGPLVVAITVQWHHRSGAEVAQRYGNSRPVEIWAHTAGAKPWPYPITREFAGDAELPGGVRALAVDPVRAEVVYWIEPARTLVAGDALLGAEGERTTTLRVPPEGWLEDEPGELSVTGLAESLRRTLQLPIELIALAHGEPVAYKASERLRQALEAAQRR
jgi:glyoxylase-like metal-dependent hydrolase (beta-lactamase superfamily II)